MLVTKVLLPAIAAPLVAGIAAMLATRLTYRMGRGADTKASEKGYRAGQIASAGLVSLAHGTNDAQKTMGIITLALVAGGASPRLRPAGVGHPLRGSRHRPRHLPGRLAHHPHHGQGPDRPPAAAGLRRPDQRRDGHPGLLAPGLLLSTTHSVSGSVMGAGLGRKGGVVRWSTATRMFVAWGLTLPAAALVAAIAEWVCGFGSWGTAVVAVFLVASSAAIWKISRREVVDHTNVNDHDTPETVSEEPAGVVTQAIAAVTPPRQALRGPLGHHPGTGPGHRRPAGPVGRLDRLTASGTKEVA